MELERLRAELARAVGVEGRKAADGLQVRNGGKAMSDPGGADSLKEPCVAKCPMEQVEELGQWVEVERDDLRLEAEP